MSTDNATTVKNRISNRLNDLTTRFTDSGAADAASETTKSATEAASETAAESARLGAVRDHISNAARSALDLTLDVPSTIIETFRTAFEEAFSGLVTYTNMTTNAYLSGFFHYLDATSHFVDAVSANDADATVEAIRAAFPSLFKGAARMTVGDALSIPMSKALRAGAKLLSGTVSLTVLKQFALPIVFMIAVGYAALKVREYVDRTTRTIGEYLHDLVEEMRDFGTHPEDAPDEPKEIEVTVTDGGDGDSGADEKSYVCPHCGQTDFPTASHFGGHVRHCDADETDEDGRKVVYMDPKNAGSSA